MIVPQILGPPKAAMPPPSAQASLVQALSRAIYGSMGANAAEWTTSIGHHLIAQLEGSEEPPPVSPKILLLSREERNELEKLLTAAVRAATRMEGSVPSQRAVAEQLLLGLHASTSRGGGLPAEIHCVLTKLDDRLVKALERGDVKLLRSAWLLAQPDGYLLQRRQDLEAGALLTPAEAVALIREGKRGAGVVSHGWLLPGCPDPAGARVALLRRVLRSQPHIKALFFDFPSLYQQPRGEEEDRAFRRALGVCQPLLDEPRSPSLPLPPSTCFPR
jgi:hypothetical protein